ncbi:MAG: arginine--tRNA ligase, partial [Candidatus Riflebacteria bacterium RBG_13_59_9]
MSELTDTISRELQAALKRYALPEPPVVLRRIAPPRDWGYATTLPQELAGIQLAADMAELEAELGKKAAKKALKTRTRELASELAVRLADSFPPGSLPGVTRVEPEGGYLNFYLDVARASRKLIASVLARAADYGRGAPQGERVMIEFSQPNTHKAFHVGHLRNVLLGNALANLYEFGGFEVQRANYYGDHGIHVAKALWGHLHPDLLAEVDDILGGAFSDSVYSRVERLLTEES